MSYVPKTIRICRDAISALESASGEPNAAQLIAIWEEFEKALKKNRSATAEEYQLGIFPQVMAMVTHFLRRANLSPEGKRVYQKAERELLRVRPPNLKAGDVPKWKPHQGARGLR